MTRKQVWVVGLIALVGGVVGGALVSLVVSGPQALAQAGAAQKVITAEAFHLVAPDGTLRASLTVDDDGAVGLRLVDKDGTPRAGLLVSADGSPGLHLVDEDGEDRAGLTVSADGALGLDLRDKDGKTRAGLVVSADGTPLLVLHDKDGNVIWGGPYPLVPPRTAL